MTTVRTISVVPSRPEKQPFNRIALLTALWFVAVATAVFVAPSDPGSLGSSGSSNVGV